MIRVFVVFALSFDEHLVLIHPVVCRVFYITEITKIGFEKKKNTSTQKKNTGPKTQT